MCRNYKNEVLISKPLFKKGLLLFEIYENSKQFSLNFRKWAKKQLKSILLFDYKKYKTNYPYETVSEPSYLKNVRKLTNELCKKGNYTLKNILSNDIKQYNTKLKINIKKKIFKKNKKLPSKKINVTLNTNIGGAKQKFKKKGSYPLGIQQLSSLTSNHNKLFQSFITKLYTNFFNIIPIEITRFTPDTNFPVNMYNSKQKNRSHTDLFFKDTLHDEINPASNKYADLEDDIMEYALDKNKINSLKDKKISIYRSEFKHLHKSYNIFKDFGGTDAHLFHIGSLLDSATPPSILHYLNDNSIVDDNNNRIFFDEAYLTNGSKQFINDTHKKIITDSHISNGDEILWNAILYNSDDSPNIQNNPFNDISWLQKNIILINIIWQLNLIYCYKCCEDFNDVKKKSEIYPFKLAFLFLQRFEFIDIVKNDLVKNPHSFVAIFKIINKNAHTFKPFLNDISKNFKINENVLDGEAFLRFDITQSGIALILKQIFFRDTNEYNNIKERSEGDANANTCLPTIFHIMDKFLNKDYTYKIYCKQFCARLLKFMGDRSHITTYLLAQKFLDIDNSKQHRKCLILTAERPLAASLIQGNIDCILNCLKKAKEKKLCPNSTDDKKNYFILNNKISYTEVIFKIEFIKNLISKYHDIFKNNVLKLSKIVSIETAVRNEKFTNYSKYMNALNKIDVKEYELLNEVSENIIALEKIVIEEEFLFFTNLINKIFFPTSRRSTFIINKELESLLINGIGYNSSYSFCRTTFFKIDHLVFLSKITDTFTTFNSLSKLVLKNINNHTYKSFYNNLKDKLKVLFTDDIYNFFNTITTLKTRLSNTFVFSTDLIIKYNKIPLSSILHNRKKTSILYSLIQIRDEFINLMKVLDEHKLIENNKNIEKNNILLTEIKNRSTQTTTSPPTLYDMITPREPSEEPPRISYLQQIMNHFSRYYTKFFTGGVHVSLLNNLSGDLAKSHIQHDIRYIIIVYIFYNMNKFKDIIHNKNINLLTDITIETLILFLDTPRITSINIVNFDTFFNIENSIYLDIYYELTIENYSFVKESYERVLTISYIQSDEENDEWILFLKKLKFYAQNENINLTLLNLPFILEVFKSFYEIPTEDSIQEIIKIIDNIYIDINILKYIDIDKLKQPISDIYNLSTQRLLNILMYDMETNDTHKEYFLKYIKNINLLTDGVVMTTNYINKFIYNK
jgi:hypothetical protein